MILILRGASSIPIFLEREPCGFYCSASGIALVCHAAVAAGKESQMLNGLKKGSLQNVAPSQLPLKGSAVLAPKSAAILECSWVLSDIYFGQVAVKGRIVSGNC